MVMMERDVEGRGGTSMEDGEEATMGFAGDRLCTAAGYR